MICRDVLLGEELSAICPLQKSWNMDNEDEGTIFNNFKQIASSNGAVNYSILFEVE